MPRISGIEIPEQKRVDIALTALYGIGRKNVGRVLIAARVAPEKRAKDLNDEEIARIQKVVDSGFKVEGDLRQEVQGNIKRLKQIGSYRGKRHAANLPVRGQRTRTNARTKRGKRVTIGALKKEELSKRQVSEGQKEVAEKSEGQ